MGHSAYSKYCDAYKLFEKKIEKNKNKKNRGKFENFTYTLHEKDSACLEYCYCVGEK